MAIKPLSEYQLSFARATVIEDMKGYGHDITKFTCDDCKDKTICKYVFDPYNTDGDCLAMK